MNPAILRLAAAVAAMMFSVAGAASTADQGQASSCRPQGSVIAVPELPEASGIAMSRRDPGRLWALNDSGNPILFALDTRGAVTGRLRLSNAPVEDWEAVAVGPCGQGSCIYVADIGDNNARRKHITLYRVEEPADGDQTVAVKDALHGTYPDGPHDAEALLATPDGGLLIVTKGETGPVGLYRFPKELRPGQTHRLERVGKPRGRGPAPPADRVTDGSVSADGQWIVLRTGRYLTFHRAADLTAGNWQEARRVDLQRVGERQGEGVALGGDNMVYLAGEGGGVGGGTFARLTCSPLTPLWPPTSAASWPQ